MGGHQFRRRANNHVVVLAVATCAASFAFLTPSQAQTLVPRGSEQPSFDCSKARTAPARLICADGELARLDGELGTAFQKRRAQLSPVDASALVADELAWIKDRNARCDLGGKNDAAIEVLATSKSCLVSAIQQRITSLMQSESTSASIAPSQQEPMALIPPSSPQPSNKAVGDQAAPTTANVQGQTEKNAAFLVEECRPLATLRGDLSDPYALSKSNPADVAKMTYCVGFLDALIASLQRNHELYRAILPDAKLLQTDETIAKRYIATMLLIGPDACLPDGLTPKIAALIVEKYGREHPEQLTDNPQKFANLALAFAYPAISNGSYLCK
jgi:uncharacterized protein YecT (DUF1311 family)